MANKILVTGATGAIGKALIKALQAKNIPFLAATRDIEESKAKLGLSDELVHFSFDDPSTFEAATAGVDKVFLLGPAMVLEMDQLINPFLDFLKSKGILRVVYLSALKSEEMGEQMSFHLKTEARLEKDGFDYTILKASFFAQNFKNYEWENIMQRGITFATAGDGKVGFIDVADIAATAAAVLTEDGHRKKTYELTGPESLTYFDAAAILTEITGKTIVYPQPSPEQYVAVLKEAGAPDFVAHYMNSVYSVIANHHVGFTTGDVEKVTGKKPNTLKSVISNDFSN